MRSLPADRLRSAECLTASGPGRPIRAMGRLRQVLPEPAESPREPRRLAIAPSPPCPPTDRKSAPTAPSTPSRRRGNRPALCFPRPSGASGTSRARWRKTWTRAPAAITTPRPALPRVAAATGRRTWKEVGLTVGAERASGPGLPRRGLHIPAGTAPGSPGAGAAGPPGNCSRARRSPLGSPDSRSRSFWVPSGPGRAETVPPAAFLPSARCSLVSVGLPTCGVDSVALLIASALLPGVRPTLSSGGSPLVGPEL